jgi:hypothetical protein
MDKKDVDEKWKYETNKTKFVFSITDGATLKKTIPLKFEEVFIDQISFILKNIITTLSKPRLN